MLKMIRLAALAALLLFAATGAIVPQVVQALRSFKRAS